jgi:hypothetical protein
MDQKLPSSEEYGIVATQVCTAVIAVVAIVEAFYPPPIWGQIAVVVLIVQMNLVNIAIAQERKRLIRIERTDRTVKEKRDVEVAAQRHAEQRGDPQALHLTQKEILAIIKSPRPEETLDKYTVAARAFGLVEEISRYLENNKLPPARRLPPALRALGQIPWDQTPEVTMARAYSEAFDDRLKALIQQFREIGVELPQKKDEAYFAPGMYSWIPLTISQIKDAANRLVADLNANLSGSAAIVAKESFEAKGFALTPQATVKMPKEKE